jgi:hypothetical protein
MIDPKDVQMMEELADALNRNTSATKRLDDAIRQLVEMMRKLLEARRPWWKR